MIACFNADQTVPCRTIVSREVVKMKSACKLQVANKLRDVLGSVSLVPDT